MCPGPRSGYGSRRAVVCRVRTVALRGSETRRRSCCRRYRLAASITRACAYGSPMRTGIVPGGPMLVDGVPVSRLATRRRRVHACASDRDRRSLSRLCRCGRYGRASRCATRSLRSACFEEEPTGTVTEPGPVPIGTCPILQVRPSIALKPDGPIRVAGDVDITYGEATARRLRPCGPLCRCGASRCQPICDSSHKIVGFRG